MKTGNILLGLGVIALVGIGGNQLLKSQKKKKVIAEILELSATLGYPEEYSVELMEQRSIQELIAVRDALKLEIVGQGYIQE